MSSHVNEPLDRLRAAVRALDLEEQTVFAEFVMCTVAVVMNEGMDAFKLGADEAKLALLDKVVTKLRKAVEEEKS